MRSEPATIRDVREGGKRALARALSTIETDSARAEAIALLDAAAREPRGHVLGLTGPPGVGKSTLTDALIRLWRDGGETVGVVAVDPSSQITQGALLGDRTRLKTDPDDHGVFVRSMAARDRLGGLSDDALGAVVLMRAIFDHVIVESVGIGQSESDIATIADTTVLCIQPGSGDALQFMKAGVMELPDIVAVTKADMQEAARRAAADVEGALTLTRPGTGWSAPVILVSATTGAGVDRLLGAVADHADWLGGAGRLAARRAAQTGAWIVQAVRSRYGTEGLKAVVADLPSTSADAPFSAAECWCRKALRRLAAGAGGA